MCRTAIYFKQLISPSPSFTCECSVFRLNIPTTLTASVWLRATLGSSERFISMLFTFILCEPWSEAQQQQKAIVYEGRRTGGSQALIHWSSAASTHFICPPLSVIAPRRRREWSRRASVRAKNRSLMSENLMKTQISTLLSVLRNKKPKSEQRF